MIVLTLVRSPEHTQFMFYDDEARRFNFLSGLLLGAVLGTGLALIAAPQGRRKVTKKMTRKTRRYASSLRHAVERGGGMRMPGKGAGRNPMREIRRAARRR